MNSPSEASLILPLRVKGDVHIDHLHPRQTFGRLIEQSRLRFSYTSFFIGIYWEIPFTGIILGKYKLKSSLVLEPVGKHNRTPTQRRKNKIKNNKEGIRSATMI